MPRILTTEAAQAIMQSHPHWFGAHYLRLLHRVHWRNIEEIRERRLARLQLAERIAACAEGGQILVIESGRDCDGVEYDGRTRLIDATLAAFLQLDSEIGEWADGPYRLAVARPSEAAGIRYESRDLVLEAMENGHRHTIVSRFP